MHRLHTIHQLNSLLVDSFFHFKATSCLCSSFLYFVVVKSGGWFGMMIMVLQWNELAHSFMVKKQLDFTKQAEKCSYPCLDLIMLLCSAPSPLFPHSATIMCMYVHVTWCCWSNEHTHLRKKKTVKMFSICTQYIKKFTNHHHTTTIIVITKLQIMMKVGNGYAYYMYILNVFKMMMMTLLPLIVGWEEREASALTMTMMISYIKTTRVLKNLCEWTTC